MNGSVLSSILLELREIKQILQSRGSNKPRQSRAKSTGGRLPLPDDIWVPDVRLQQRQALWAQVGLRMGTAGHTAYEFLRYVVHDWNCNTYVQKPLTRTNGHMNIYVGTPDRVGCSVVDMFGSERKKFDPVAAAEARFLEFSCHLTPCVHVMQEDERYDALGASFLGPLLYMGSGPCHLLPKGGLCTEEHFEWDHRDRRAPDWFSRSPQLRSFHKRCMTACRDGVMALQMDPDDATVALIAQAQSDASARERKESRKADAEAFMARLRQQVGTNKMAAIHEGIAMAAEEAQVQEAIAASLQQPAEMFPEQAEEKQDL